MKPNQSIKTILHIAGLLVVLALAWALRWRAVNLLPIDYDEDDYLRAGQEFAHLIRTGDWPGFLHTNYRAEHPPLAKIAYGLAILDLPEQPLIPDIEITAQPASSLPKDLLHRARTEAAIFGTLTAGLLALLNPIGGLFLAIHTITVKFTGQVMLDGLSALLSLSMVLAYVRYKKSKKNTWLVASAVLLGLAADSKFLHGTIGFAVLLDWYLESRKKDEVRKYTGQAFLWGVLSLVVFFAANPYLWPDPFGRLRGTFEAVTYTTTNPNVDSANFPIWQPFVWLSMTAADWHPEVIVIGLDILIFILAIFGFKRLWEAQRVFAIWLALGMLTLLLWRTKWPQYILVITAPLTLAAAEGIRLFFDNLTEWWKNRKTQTQQHYQKREVRGAIPWLAPGLIVFAAFTLFPLLFQFVISLTDFNSVSIRDGLQGGIWREVWRGLTGQIVPVDPEFPFRSTEVQFTGPSSYQPMFGLITQSGILVFNIIWMVFSVVLQTALGVGTALLLWNQGVRFRRGWQALFILPWAIPETIGALMWLTIFASPFGWLSLAVQDFGPNVPFGFLNGWESSPNTILVVLLIVGVWYGFPFMMLAATAGLKLVPTDVFDAAAIDGANAWQTFRHVTWPLLVPLVLPAVIIRGIFAFNQFYLIQIFGFLHYDFSMTTMATLSYNIFNPSGFFNFNGQFAISAALNLITMVILIGFVILFNRWSKAGEGVTYA